MSSNLETFRLSERPAALISGPLRLLVLEDGGFSTHALPESGEVSIGRAEECGVCLQERSISRRHATLRLGEVLTIEDLGSANGTRVRDRQLRGAERAEISPGEPVEVGSVVLVVQRIAGAVRSAPPVQDAMRHVHKLVERIVGSMINVLLLGETGVGKEVLAGELHRKSPRASGPMLRLNCAALSETLLESELFGHEKGAFTGAIRSKPGLLETAAGGTVLLDEVGELPLSIQAKLLRVLEERHVLRVGGIKPQPIDVRFIFATNRDLEAEVARGAFRQDLYYRLNGFPLIIPPLRERVSEIAPLAKSLADDAAKRDGRAAPTFSPEALAKLERYSWPGNIRELRNVIERAMLLGADGVISASDLHLGAKPLPSATSATPLPPVPDGTSLREGRDAAERRTIREALEQCSGNQTRAAKLLGISRRTLVSRLQSYGLTRKRNID